MNNKVNLMQRNLIASVLWIDLLQIECFDLGY
jgi:hypothetical protein